MKYLTKLFISILSLMFCFLPLMANSINYTVQKGDTLYSIARQYNVTVQELLNTNNMGSDSSIYAGQVILITADEENADSSDKNLTTKAETYIVESGDTLFAISMKYGVSVDSISQLNNLKNGSSIYVGQKLIIHSDTTNSSNLETSQNDKIDETNSESSGSIVLDSVSVESSQKEVTTTKNVTYKVQKGDTLYSIARDNNTSVAKIRKMNELTTDSVLKIGQTLIFDTGEVITLDDLEEVTDPRSYKTKKGDTNLIWPVKATEVAYITGKISGVAITASSKNESVTAIHEGVVMYSGNYRGYGDVVFIKSENNYIYMYSGLSSLSVEKGQQVNYRQEIGKSGTDVYSGNPVINLMVYKNDDPVDPATAPRG